MNIFWFVWKYFLIARRLLGGRENLFNPHISKIDKNLGFYLQNRMISPVEVMRYLNGKYTSEIREICSTIPSMFLLKIAKYPGATAKLSFQITRVWVERWYESYKNVDTFDYRDGNDLQDIVDLTPSMVNDLIGSEDNMKIHLRKLSWMLANRNVITTKHRDNCAEFYRKQEYWAENSDYFAKLVADEDSNPSFIRGIRDEGRMIISAVDIRDSRPVIWMGGCRLVDKAEQSPVTLALIANFIHKCPQWVVDAYQAEYPNVVGKNPYIRSANSHPNDGKGRGGLLWS